MPYRELLPHFIEGETADTMKKITNIDKEDFEFTWAGEKGAKTTYQLKAGETKELPKYLCNFGSFHLARKIVKREAIAEAEAAGKNLQKDDIKIRNEEKEIELQKQMLGLSEEKVSEKPAEGTSLKCPQCDFTAKSEFGLKAHMRKHK